MNNEPRFYYVTARHEEYGPFDVVARYGKNDQHVRASCTSYESAQAAKRLLEVK